jgi:hypothetical protein
MKRERNPYVREYALKHLTEPSLRDLADMYTETAEQHEREAAIARENARHCLEAAEARAEEKRAKKEARSKRQQVVPVFS